ncbi:MAG: 4'-phosphopantetheinyl transferase superfamily protein [Phycisphaerae bacterium]|nr:4'-phosphopantetheinyl transferase superfamily protein [Phycisphaerae bacterium]
MNDTNRPAPSMVTVYWGRVGSGPSRPTLGVRRAYLRETLAHELGTGGPRRLSHTPAGRPVLDGGGGGSPDDVSAASTAEMVVVAIAQGCRVGVDVERIDPAGVSLGLLEESLTASERAWVQEGHDPTRFFHLWCRKEAVLKGLGLGLALHPRTMAVDAAPDPDGWRPVETPVERWWVRSWEEGDCVLALAVDRRGARVSSRQFAVPLSSARANDGP